MSVEQWRGLGRVLVGAFVTLIALLKLVRPDAYLPGDWRSDPVLWAAFSGLFLLLGLGCLLSGALSLLRRPR